MRPADSPAAPKNKYVALLRRPMRGCALVLLVSAVLLASQPAEAQRRLLDRLREAAQEVQEEVEELKHEVQQLGDTGSGDAAGDSDAGNGRAAIPAPAQQPSPARTPASPRQPESMPSVSPTTPAMLRRGGMPPLTSSQTASLNAAKEEMNGIGASCAALAEEHGTVPQIVARADACRTDCRPNDEALAANIVMGFEPLTAELCRTRLDNVHVAIEAWNLARVPDTTPAVATVEPTRQPQLPQRFAGYELQRHLDRIYSIYPGALRADDPMPNLLFQLYVEEYYGACEHELPPTRRSYTHERLTYAGSKYLAYRTIHYYEWVVDRTIEMRPELFDPYATSVASLVSKAIGDIVTAFTDPFAPEPVVIDEALFETARRDMQRYLSETGCTGQELRSFEQKLVRAALDPPPYPRNTPFITVNTGFAGTGTRYEYPEVDLGFVPEIPDPLPPTPVTFLMHKPLGGSELRQIEITELFFGLKALRDAPADPEDPDTRTFAVDFLAAAYEQARVITCTYASGRWKVAWYRERPPSADPARLRQRLPAHPLLAIDEPIDRCPASPAR